MYIHSTSFTSIPVTVPTARPVPAPMLNGIARGATITAPATKPALIAVIPTALVDTTVSTRGTCFIEPIFELFKPLYDLCN